MYKKVEENSIAEYLPAENSGELTNFFKKVHISFSFLFQTCSRSKLLNGVELKF